MLRGSRNQSTVVVFGCEVEKDKNGCSFAPVSLTINTNQTDCLIFYILL